MAEDKNALGGISSLVDLPGRFSESFEKASNVFYRLGRNKKDGDRILILRSVLRLQDSQQQQQQQQMQQWDVDGQMQHPVHSTVLGFDENANLIALDGIEQDAKIEIVRFNIFLNEMNSRSRSVLDMMDSHPDYFDDVPVRKEIIDAMNIRQEIVKILDDFAVPELDSAEFFVKFFAMLRSATDRLEQINDALRAYITREQQALDHRRGRPSPA